MLRSLLSRLPYRAKAVPSVAEPWSLQTPLFGLARRDPFTVGNAVENVLIVGGIGAGKTSSSGRTLATAYLKAGFGALVLAAKPEEPELWRHYCKVTGRTGDLIEFGPQHPWRFDPLAFELGRPGVGAGHTENLVQLFSALLDLGEQGSGGGGGGGARRGSNTGGRRSCSCSATWSTCSCWPPGRSACRTCTGWRCRPPPPWNRSAAPSGGPARSAFAA